MSDKPETTQKSPVSRSACLVEQASGGSQPIAGHGAGEPGVNSGQPQKFDGWDCDDGWELATPENLSEVFNVKPVNLE